MVTCARGQRNLCESTIYIGCQRVNEMRSVLIHWRECSSAERQFLIMRTDT